MAIAREDLLLPKTGIPIKDRRHLLRKYSQCFVGEELQTGW